MPTNSYLLAGRCKACAKEGLTITGFQHHIQQKQNKLCSDVFYREMASEAMSSSEPSSTVNTTPADLGEDWVPNAMDDDNHKPVTFAGDAFGGPQDYLDDDFGQGSDYGKDPEENWDDEEDDGDDAALAEMERGWELPLSAGRGGAERGNPSNTNMDVDERDLSDGEEETHSSSAFFGRPMSLSQRREAELRAGTTPYILKYSEAYPESRAGAIHKRLQAENSQQVLSSDNVYAPFQSKMDWEIAQWAKLRGPGSTAFYELLLIDGVGSLPRYLLNSSADTHCSQVREALGLSFGTTQELNATIDKHLPGRPKFHRKETVIEGEAHEFYARNILECILALWGEPDFAHVLVFEPERHSLDEDQKLRLFHDMHTGKWWWGKQVRQMRRSASFYLNSYMPTRRSSMLSSSVQAPRSSLSSLHQTRPRSPSSATRSLIQST